MMSIVESELQRARWRRTLDRLGIDRIDRDDFAGRAIAARLDTPSVLALLQPSDPEQDSVELDSSFTTWLKLSQVVGLEGRRVVLGGDSLQLTAHSSAYIPAYSSGRPWEHYFAVHRSGALEMGLGNRGVYEYPVGAQGEKARIFNLVTTVAYMWAMMNFAADYCAQYPIAGPWQMTLAVPQTENALLGNLGLGWPEPSDGFSNRVGGCRDPHLLWHWELDSIPPKEKAQDLAFKIGNRLEDAWGVPQRRYLDRTGQRSGHLDLNRIAH